MTGDLGDLDVLRGPGWVRLLRAARRRLESSGGSVTGSVGVGVPSDEERRVVIAVTGRHRPPDVARVSVQLSDVDGWLRRSHGLGLFIRLRRGARDLGQLIEKSAAA